MPILVDLIDPALLQQPPPRRLPLMLLPNLLGEYLIEMPLRAYFDRVVMFILAGAVLMALLDVGRWAWIALSVILVLRLGVLIWNVSRRAQEDMMLLRQGLIIQAYVLRARPGVADRYRPGGCYLDCAMPIGPQRTSIGSIWLADINEAQCLFKQGRIRVICLPRAPGTWRLIEGTMLKAVYYGPLRDGQSQNRR